MKKYKDVKESREKYEFAIYLNIYPYSDDAPTLPTGTVEFSPSPYSMSVSSSEMPLRECNKLIDKLKKICEKTVKSN